MNVGKVVRGRPVLGYGMGVVTFLIALWGRHALDGVLPQGFPYLTFFPAVILTTFVAGTGAGVLCAGLCGLAAWYFFIPPFNSFTLNGSSALALGFYLFIVTVDIALLHFMRVAADRLHVERERTAGLYDQQRTMFQELQHRVANNMTFVSSLLHLQKRKVEAEPAGAAQAFEEATRRIEIMARVHRRLYDPASVERPLGQYLEELCGDLIDATGARGVRCAVDVPADVRLDIDMLMTLSLLVTEVVTNSLKHAFVGRNAGTIRLAIERLEPGRLRMTIADDGRGMPDDANPSGKGLGTRIVQGLASQLGGDIETVSDNGVTIRISFAG